MSDIDESLVGGGAALLRSAAAKLIATTYSDGNALVSSFISHGTKAPTKQALEKVKKDIQELSPIGKPLGEEIKSQFETAKAALKRMDEELGKPFTLGNVARAMEDFATIMKAFDASIRAVADAAAAKPGGGTDTSIRDDILNIREP